jgi:hypothetical protein
VRDASGTRDKGERVIIDHVKGGVLGDLVGDKIR